MSNAERAELRIHTGIHAGAYSRLSIGHYLVGSAPHCDFIISDEGIGDERLEIAVQEDCWSYRLSTDNGNAEAKEIILLPGTAIMLGPIVISVESPAAPWRTPERSVDQEKTRTGHASSSEENGEPVMTAGSGENSEPSPLNSVPFSPAREANHSRPIKKQRTVLRVAFLLCLSAVLLSAILWGLGDKPSPPQKLSQTASANAVFEARKARVVAILERLNMLDRARIERQANNSVVVNMALVSEVEYEELASALAQLNPRPGLRYSDENALSDAVREALAARAPSVKSDYLGAGHFRLSGKLASENERDELLRSLTTAFPTARSFQSDILTPPMMAELLLKMLQDIDVAVVGHEWNDDLFSVDVKLPQSRLLNLKQTLVQAESEYGQWLKFVVRPHGEKDEIRATPASVQLPFKIQGVVGGEVPYIVLSGNAKVLAGGSVGKWRLVEIARDHLVFDGPQRLIVAR